MIIRYVATCNDVLHDSQLWLVNVMVYGVGFTKLAMYIHIYIYVCVYVAHAYTRVFIYIYISPILLGTPRSYIIDNHMYVNISTYLLYLYNSIYLYIYILCV